jgi:hypothetical protein
MGDQAHALVDIRSVGRKMHVGARSFPCCS